MNVPGARLRFARKMIVGEEERMGGGARSERR
jgi:hypothetical protein